MKKENEVEALQRVNYVALTA